MNKVVFALFAFLGLVLLYLTIVVLGQLITAGGCP